MKKLILEFIRKFGIGNMTSTCDFQKDELISELVDELGIHTDQIVWLKDDPYIDEIIKGLKHEDAEIRQDAHFKSCEQSMRKFLKGILNREPTITELNYLFNKVICFMTKHLS